MTNTKGTNMGDSTATTCRCSRPTRDAYTVCDTCTDTLSVALGEIPWLDDELETTITRQKGVTYNGSGGKGGKKPTDMPSPVHWGASEAKSHLKSILVSWVKFCADENVRNASPQYGLPADNLPAISRWLMWRVDGLALHDIGADAVEEITDAVTACHRKIDRPADRQYLGECSECAGDLYAMPRGEWATCETCGQKTKADAIRNQLVDKLDDRLCTAAEIARLSTYLGLQADREKVRKLVNQWHKRKRITPEHAFSSEPVFRFGIVRRLLQHDDAKSA